MGFGEFLNNVVGFFNLFVQSVATFFAVLFKGLTFLPFVFGVLPGQVDAIVMMSVMVVLVGFLIRFLLELL